jgi:hypothetical protein
VDNSHQLQALSAAVAERDELIRWLAMPYRGSAPVFAYEGEQVNVPGTDGRPSGHKAMLARVWADVVGEPVDESGAYWAQCRTCGSHVLYRQEAVSG